MNRGTLTQTTGILLAGAHPWTNSAFDSLPPRTLLPVGHRPLISYGLAWMQRAGISDVVVCGNRETRVLQSRLSRLKPLGMQLLYRQDPMPRGPAGCARDAALMTNARTFVVAEGTAIPTVDLDAVLECHRESGACVTVVVHLEKRNGSPALRAPSGIYVFERRALEAVPAHGFYDIKESLIPQLYAKGERIEPYESASPAGRVLDADTYMAVSDWVIDELVRGSELPEGYERSEHGLIHREAYVAADASIIGPVLVAPGARILAGAVVVGPSSIGREATIESGAMVSRSAIWRRSSVGAFATLDRAIVSDDAVVETGAEIVHEIVTGSSPVVADWVEQQYVYGRNAAPREMGTRLSRLLFGGGWSRSPAAP